MFETVGHLDEGTGSEGRRERGLARAGA
jgi:hypothetical protein